MKKLLYPFILVLTLLAAPAAARADYYFVTLLAGANEVPPTASPGAGVGLVILSDDFSTMSVIEVFDDLTGPATAAHIHVGDPTVSGPVILPFGGFPNDTDGFYTTDLTADNFIPGGGLQTFDDAVQALFDGNLYMNIHTQMFPGGEIRGQLYYFGP